MLDIEMVFENFNTDFFDHLENMVDDYDYEGGFDATDIEVKNDNGTLYVKFRSNKTFSLDDEELDDNFADVLLGRGNFLSSIYFSLDDFEIDADSVRVAVNINGEKYVASLSKDCDLMPA